MDAASAKEGRSLKVIEPGLPAKATIAPKAKHASIESIDAALLI